MKKIDKARFYRNGYNAMRKEMMKDIINIFMEAENNELELDGERGSLVYNSINDQENEMIMSMYIKYNGNKLPIVMARIGVYEPDYEVEVNDMGIELLLNVFEAVEKAFNEPLEE
jgi:ribonucleotide reductase beta subunit family protein with ferritin-like domain